MKHLFLSLLCLGFLLPMSAQDDLGGIVSVELSKKIFSKWTLSFEEEFRMQEYFSKSERFSSALDISYKPVKFLKIGAAYNFMYNQYYRNKKAIWDWECRHRYYVYASGDYTFGRFNLSLRERFQSTYRQSNDYTDPSMYLRSRLELEYNIRKSPFEPFISIEMFYRLNQGETGINRWRYMAGCAYKIDKKNAFQLFGRYTGDVDDDNDEDSGYMIGLGYSHKF